VSALALALALTVGGCGSNGDSSSTSAPDAGAPQVGVAEAGSGAGGGAPAGAPVADSAVKAEVGEGSATTDRRIVRTAEITVEVDQLATPAARIRQAAVDLGGFVSTETTGYAAPGAPVTTTDSAGKEATRQALTGQSVLVLRIPEPKLTQALDRAAGVGKELSRSSSAEDVTGDIADLTSRTATQKASVARVRQLLAGAKTLQEIVLLESELTKRESELEALQARLATLANRADLATLTVVLQTPAVQEPQEDNRFVKGLRNGWNALLDSTGVLITLVGALLPFALVGALVGLPLWRLARTRRRRPTQPTAPLPMPLAPTTPPDPPTQP
jgi:hypothetical protein